ncbi:ATP-binding protein [Catellatospora sp. TT07R-123]|uniref:ATP-binding protein n=1 Tax=Catellatospora sp. TT07R-123 TaxID=2733863 RepID=UPI0024556093|nr:ATP-binding protein [Catellatospora sp. TT07R-123]
MLELRMVIPPVAVRWSVTAATVGAWCSSGSSWSMSGCIGLPGGGLDLLCIDELGYMELDRRSAELLFQVLTEREEKSSVAISSNQAFSNWTKTFTAPVSAPRSSTA